MHKIAPISSLLLLLTTTSLLAQGTQQPQQGSQPRSTGTVRAFGGVPTHPSSNPFKDPIGQGVPPAASTTRPFGRTNVPLNSGR